MKKVIIAMMAVLAMVSCKQQKQAEPVETSSLKAYGWSRWNPEEVSEDSLRQMFTEWKGHGLVGVCMECGFDVERTTRCAAIAHEVGLEYHAWAPSMIQGEKPESWYTVNRLGKSAFNPEDRAYVEYYQTLDPHNPEVVKFMVDSYCALAAIPNVDYVQFDYIRYADAILSEGLWEKYNDQIHHEWRTEDGVVHEYPVADYCYCDDCCADFKEKTGIDIQAKLKEGVDPQTIKEWAQFRCDNVTNLVNTVCKAVHEKGGKLSADVFPGPKSHAEWMVRQQWNKWDVDMFFPMNYNNFYLQGPEWIYTITKEEVESTDKPVMSGLMICQDWQNRKSLCDPENTGLIPSEIAEAVAGARKAGATGICLFTPQSMTEEHWKEFEKAVK